MGASRIVVPMVLVVAATGVAPLPATATVVATGSVITTGDVVPTPVPGVNPLAPFTPSVPMPGPGRTLADPVVVADGSGILAVAVRYDGIAGPTAVRRVWATRWTPSRGWSPAVALSGPLGPVETITAVGNGRRAAVAWVHYVTTAPGTAVRRLEVAVRPSALGSWARRAVIGAHDAMGPQLALSGDATAVAWHDRATDPGTGQVLEAAAAAVQPASGAAWSPRVLLGTNASLSGLQPRPSGGFVAAWSTPVWPEGPTTGLAATWSPGSGWSGPAVLSGPGAGCGVSLASSSTRLVALLSCSSGGALSLATRELGAAGWSDPVTVVPSDTRWYGAQELRVAGGVAAVELRSRLPGSLAPGGVWVSRSDRPGTWSAPVQVVSTVVGNPAMTVSGTDVAVLWAAADGSHTSRIRTRMVRAGGSMTPVRALSAAGRWVFFPWLAASPAGMVAGWQVEGRPWQVQAATWTTRGGWSVTRTLSASGVKAFGPVLAAASTAVGLGWFGPTGIRLTTASLLDPTPRGPARVTVSGRVLTCVPPVFSPRPATMSFRWLHGSTPIVNAIHSTLAVPSNLLGASLRCRVIGGTQGFAAGVAYSPYVRVAR